LICSKHFIHLLLYFCLFHFFYFIFFLPAPHFSLPIRYLRLTAADMIFNVMLQHLSGLEPAWIVYQYLLFVVIILTIVYFVMFPKEASREEQLQADLEEMLHPTKTKGKCCGCVIS
jgi:hypothetical protein